jgi:hypothetical protein
LAWEAVVTGPMSVHPPVQARMAWHWRDGQVPAGLAGVTGHYSAKLRRMENTGANTPSRAAPAPRPSFSTRLDLDFAFWAVVVHSLGSTSLCAVQRKMRGDQSGSHKGLQLLVELDSTWCETACCLISCIMLLARRICDTLPIQSRYIFTLLTSIVSRNVW